MTGPEEFVAAWRAFGVRFFLNEAKVWYPASDLAWWKISWRDGHVFWGWDRFPPNWSAPVQPKSEHSQPTRTRRPSFRTQVIANKKKWISTWEPLTRHDERMMWQANPSHLGLGREPELWWEIDEGWEPDAGFLSEREMRDALWERHRWGRV